MNVGIVGCGLMGRVRARSIAELASNTLKAVFDTNADRAGEMNAVYGCEIEGSYESLVGRPDLDAVIVAVPHHLSRDICVAALRSGKHVFCEKPLGVTARDCSEIMASADTSQVLAVGFNYRFYPGVQLARKLIREGAIGELTHIRSVLAHGARPGYEREWKTSRLECGGGALLDPGIHVIDLMHFFVGEIESADAVLLRSFWPIDVEDNAFVNLRTKANCCAQLHVSVTEWKNRFTLEFLGTEGYVHLSGRGGFYGRQVVRFNRRWPWLESPVREESVWEFSNADVSFTAELNSFFRAVESGDSGDLATGKDGLRSIRLIESLYAAAPVRESRAASAAVASIA